MCKPFFSVGDVVTIRSDLAAGTCYRSEDQIEDGIEATCFCQLPMADLGGTRVTIKEITNNLNTIRYRIDNLMNGYAWTAEMFEEFTNRGIDAGEFEPATSADFLSLLYGGKM